MLGGSKESWWRRKGVDSGLRLVRIRQLALPVHGHISRHSRVKEKRQDDPE